MNLRTFIFLSTLILSLNAFQLTVKKKLSKTDPCFDFLCSDPLVLTIPIYRISGYIKSAVTGQVVSSSNLQKLHANVTFSSDTQTYVAAIDFNTSIYSVNLPAGVYYRNGSIDSFINSTTTVNITTNTSESDNQNTIFFAPIFQGWRTVLTWNGSIDKDLDSYTRCPDKALVYYKQKNSTDSVVHLDVDSRDSGPETTQYNFKYTSNGVWAFYVQSFRKTVPLTSTQAKVTVFHGDRQISEVHITNKADVGANYWHVFDLQINGNVQNYQEVNRIDYSMFY